MKQPMPMRMRAMLACVLLAAALSTTVPLQAQESVDAYPSKPVTILLASAGSSSIDVEFRLYSQSIMEKTGKQFVLDYKGGGGGTIGITYAARAAPDGYLLHAATSSLVTTPHMHSNLTYDVLRDFAPITLMTKHVFLLVVHPSAPFRNARDYIDYARSHPGELNWGTAGIGNSSHMPGALLHSMSKTQVAFVHYKQASQRLVDLMAGRIQVAFGSTTAVMPHVRSGKMRALAVSSLERAKSLPSIPAIAETIPDYEVITWWGMLGPEGIPPPIVSALNAEINRILVLPEVEKIVGAAGAEITIGSPEQFRQVIGRGLQSVRNLIDKTGISLH